MMRWPRLLGLGSWKLSMRPDPSRAQAYAWLGSAVLHLLLALILYPASRPPVLLATQQAGEVLKVRIHERPRLNVKPARLPPRAKPSPIPASAPSLSASTAASDAEDAAEGGETETAAASEAQSEGADQGPPASYFLALRERIQAQKQYPYAARRLGLEGVVTLSFTIDALGRLTSVQIDSSEAPLLLQKAAERTLRQSAPFEAPGEALTLRINLFYRLKTTDESQLELALDTR